MADAPVFKAVVGASIVQDGAKRDWTVHDFIGVDGKSYLMVTYVNEKTKEAWTADETTASGTVSATQVQYSGKMVNGKDVENFSLVLANGSPGSVQFSLAGKHPVAVNGPLSYQSFYLNP